jgi:D-lactate dehydrogenase (cytochrome)
MSTSRARTQAPPGSGVAPPPIATDRDELATYEEDAARSRGRASGVARPASEAELAALLARASREGRAVLAQGARSSLTAGATPRDDLVLSTERLERVLEIRRTERGGLARIEPGVRLRHLNEVAREHGLWFPPVPTYDLCCAGGAVSTNAAGAATFKHGPVRAWVRALRLVLASGEVLALERGEVAASAEGFELESRDGKIARVPLPRYRTPPLKKIACGYFVRDGVDLVDIIIGSEGTLGVVSEVVLELAPLPGSVLTGLASFPDEALALAFTAAVRAASEETWRAGDPNGLDVRALEIVDAASLDLVRARGRSDEILALPPPGACAVLWEQELAQSLDDEVVAQALERGLSGDRRGPVERLGALLAEHRAGDDVIVALPHDERGRRTISRVREVVPEAVNDLVAERKRSDPGVRKVAGDMVVPFERLPEMLARYREAFARRGLACAIWGHVSDGNLHPNVLARTGAEARSGEEALLELGDVARALGGAPLSEHGVGKSPLKQELVRRFYGDAAIEDMARLKLAFDPSGVLAPGNIFPPERLVTSGRRPLE